MKYEVAVMGDLGSIVAFRGLGFTVVPILELAGAEQELYRLIDSKKYGIIYVTEPVANACSRVLANYRSQAIPAIIPIPAAGDKGGIALQNLRESVIKAVGFDVIANNKKNIGENRNEEY